MSLDFPAFGTAAWSLADATGIRPEFLLPVLDLESGFDPAATNSAGCTGINQRCGNVPAGYGALSASEQMTSFVAPMFKSVVAKYGPLRSAVRVYQANLLPASLPLATRLTDVIVAKGSPKTIGGLTQDSIYTANAGLDSNRDGTITLQDLANKMAQMAARPVVQQAIAQTYALRPGETPNDPVFGDDYPWYTRLTPAEKLLAAAAALGVGALGFVAAREYGYL